MPWARFDDRLHTNRKIMQIDNDAMAIWVCSVTYCNENLTDGFLTERDADRLLALRIAPRDAIEQLLAISLWERAPGGYRVHDYLDYNPSKEEVEADRENTRKRQEKHRGKSGREESGQFSVSNGVSHTVSNAVSNTVPGPGPGSVPGPEIPGVAADASADDVASLAATAAPSAAPNGSPDFLQKPLFERYADRLRSETNKVGILMAAFTELYGTRYAPNPGRIGKLAKGGAGEFLRTMILAAPGWSGVDDPHDYLTVFQRQRAGRTNGATAAPPSEQPQPSVPDVAPDIPPLTPAEEAAIEEENRARWHERQHQLRLKQDPAYRAKCEREEALRRIRENPPKRR